MKEHWTVTHIFNHLPFSPCTTLCFLSPLWEQQEKALAKGLLHHDPIKHSGLKSLLSVTAEHFCLVILYSTYVNVFNYSCGFALFLYFLCILHNILLRAVNCSSKADVKHIYPAKPKTGPVFHHVAVVAQ